MSKSQIVRSLVNERLTAAAEDIFALFERTIAEYEEELCRSKEENERKQQLLDSVLSPQVLQVHRADVQTQVAIENLKEEAEKCTIQKKGHPQELPFTAQQNQKETEVDCGEAVTDVIIEQHGEIILETEEQIENDGEFQSPFGCSAEQMETEAEGGDYNQVQINDETTDVQIPDVLSKPKCRRGTAKNKRRSAILSNVRQKHQCSVCGKYLKGPKTNLVRHMFLHTGVRPFSCTVCEKSFTQQVNLREHMENHQKDENEEGQRQTEQQVDVKKPMGTREDDEKESVQLLHKQTEHMKETQMEDSGVVKVYGESEAHGHSEAETKGQRQTVEHREETQAEDCGGVEAEVESEAHGHSEAETKGHDEKNENQEFPGSSAAQQGEPEVKGEEHSAACTENRCSVCERVFLNKTRLKRHMLVHTGEKPYSCPVCNKLFSQKYNVRLHMAVHTDEKPFTCEVCLKSYRRNDDLRTHMTTHTGEILFTCFVCNTVFKQRNSLKTHMRLHTGDRPYSCTMCSKTFIQKSNLNRHIRIHTGEKPFRCPVCPQRFIQRSDIRRHLAVHL